MKAIKQMLKSLFSRPPREPNPELEEVKQKQEEVAARLRALDVQVSVRTQRKIRGTR